MKPDLSNLTAENTKQLLRRLVELFTRNHEFIEIEECAIFGGQGVRFVMRVHKAEHSKVVGKAGRHIKALQIIVDACAPATGKKLLLSLDEPRFGDKQASGADTDWNARAVEEVLAATMEAVRGGQIQAMDTETCTHYDCQALGLAVPVQEAIKAIFSAIGTSHGRTIEFAFL